MMKAIILVTLVLLVTLSFTKEPKKGGMKPDEAMEGVVELTNANFDQIISNKHVLVEFYAPWCGYCQDFSPKMKILGRLISKSSRSADLTVAKCDGSKYSKLTNRYKVEGFPTFLLFKKGVSKPIEHDSAMSVKGLLDFLHKNLD